MDNFRDWCNAHGISCLNNKGKLLTKKQLIRRVQNGGSSPPVLMIEYLEMSGVLIENEPAELLNILQPYVEYIVLHRYNNENLENGVMNNIRRNLDIQSTLYDNEMGITIYLLRNGTIALDYINAAVNDLTIFG